MHDQLEVMPARDGCVVEPVYTLDEVATHLRCSLSKVKVLIHRSEIKSVKIGHHRRVKASQLAAYVDSLEPAA